MHNELFAYLYDTDKSPRRILYIAEAYQAYLSKNSEAGIGLNYPARDIQCASIRPGSNFIGYGSNDQNEEVEAQNVVRIKITSGELSLRKWLSELISSTTLLIPSSPS